VKDSKRWAPCHTSKGGFGGDKSIVDLPFYLPSKHCTTVTHPEGYAQWNYDPKSKPKSVASEKQQANAVYKAQLNNLKDQLSDLSEEQIRIKGSAAVRQELWPNDVPKKPATCKSVPSGYEPETDHLPGRFGHNIIRDAHPSCPNEIVIFQLITVKNSNGLANEHDVDQKRWPVAKADAA